LITDQDLTKAEELNAERYHEFSRSKNEMAFEGLRYAVRSMSFPTSVDTLARSLDAGNLGFRKGFIAIYEGLLSVDRMALIDTDKGQHAFLTKRYPHIQIAIAVTNRVHEYEFNRF
jgi:hypothetical protein